MIKKLYRTEGPDAKLFGVCGGLAEYFNIDPTILRVALVLLVWLGGLSLWIYLLAALIIPRKSEVYPGF
ncbi:PspC domain-containing protein [Flavonifractor sp. An92]|uniref:PspC domain-containing protein n=1 Tax=Flavonifractor sp. An92 TaxID=1965666 RepID=UPI000B37B074|nr:MULTISPECIES: PspC domain-containing protein [unclassified Flavonifractor]OUN06278.1 PspC domain-containing protein [Flavonifractor sp. An92]OUQ22862.1 PspC domain-containing protein [Flavonifractor sp. An135]